MRREEGRRLLALERHRFILDHLREHSSVEVSFLADQLSVSEVTVRKDLEKLEQDRVLVRSHGGAVLSEDLLAEPSFVEKEDQLADEKQAIAQAAFDLVADDTTIALSTGTTVGRLARKLLERRGLTVVTNALNVANTFVGSDFEIFLTGGSLRKNTFGLVGEAAEHGLEPVTYEYAFIGTNGISVENGLTTPSMEEARVVRAMMNNARHVVLLADHTKFDHIGFYRICPAERVHTIITDAGAPAEQLDRLRAAGIEVLAV